RWGERRLPRMVERCAMLALPRGENPPPEWPHPELVVPPAEILAWRQRLGLAPDGRRVVALAPGAVGPSKRWGDYRELARRLAAEGNHVCVLGAAGEGEAARDILRAEGRGSPGDRVGAIRDLT